MGVFLWVYFCKLLKINKRDIKLISNSANFTLIRTPNAIKIHFDTLTPPQYLRSLQLNFLLCLNSIYWVGTLCKNGWLR